MLSIYPTRKVHRDGFHPQPSHTSPIATAAITVAFGLLVSMFLVGGFFVWLAVIPM